MGISRKMFGVFAAAVLSLSMVAGAAAQDGVPTNAELVYEACSVEAAGGSALDFDLTWNGTHFVPASEGTVVVEVAGVNLIGTPWCLIDVALEGGQLDHSDFGPFWSIQEDRFNASVPGQPGGDLPQSFILQSFLPHNMTIEVDDLEGYHTAGLYDGTLNLSVNTGP